MFKFYNHRIKKSLSLSLDTIFGVCKFSDFVLDLIGLDSDWMRPYHLLLNEMFLTRNREIVIVFLKNPRVNRGKLTS